MLRCATLEAFLRGILVGQLEKSEEYVAATVSSFKEEDINNVTLLVALLENSKANAAGLETFNEFKKGILVENRKLSTVFWVLLEKQLEWCASPRATLQRIRSYCAMAIMANRTVDITYTA